jgi:PBSX family phage terminase large subunit
VPSPVEHRYAPRGACARLLELHDPEILLSGPAGTGKSRACLEKLNLVALKYPGARLLIVRKTAVSLTSTALVTWRQHVAKTDIEHGLLAWYGGSAEEPAQYRYTNGSSVVVGGMDHATRIMSSDYDLAYAQEAIELTVNDWEHVTTRLRNGVVPYQQLIADTNPASQYHWLNQRCLAGATTRLESRHEDNPRLFDQAGKVTAEGRAYLAKLDALTGVRKQRLRYGQWVSAEGTVYDGYDPAVHLVDPFPIPDDWPRWWSVDFGFVHPFVCQMWARDPDGRVYLYREVYHTGRLVEDHAKTILAVTAGEPRPQAVICDHDAEDRATLAKHLGMATKAARKTVSDGIQAVAARLKVAGDGRARLFLFRDAVVQRDQTLVDALRPACTAEEIPGYVWADTARKEAPVKEDDDGMDAMRYLVAELDLGRVANVRWM